MALGLEQTGEETSQEVPKSNRQALEVWEETHQQCRLQLLSGLPIVR